MSVGCIRIGVELYVGILRLLSMRSEGNAPQNGEPALGFTYTTMLQHIGRCGQEFINKEQCDNAGAFPAYSTALDQADCYLYIRNWH
jgi:hypothetical protein